MPREKPLYRDQLEDILDYTKGRRLMSATDVGNYLGICRQTAAKRYNIKRDGITAIALARELTK